MEAGSDLHLPADGLTYPLVIAEIGSNHRNDFETGRRLVRELAEAGISWVKFQLWKSEDVWVVPPAGVVEPDPAIVRDLLELSRDIGLRTVLSVFSRESLGDVDLTTVDRWKIAAARAGDRDLVESLPEAFISSGFAEPGAFIRQAQTFGLTPLICVSKYPASPEEYGLGTWKGMLPADLPWGISDHTASHGTSLAAVALGASWIERHVDLDEIRLPPTRDQGPHVDSPGGLGALQTLAREVALAIRQTPVLRNPVRRVVPLG